MADVMLDPSLLTPRLLDRLSYSVEQLVTSGRAVYLPSTFFELLETGELRRETYDLLQGRSATYRGTHRTPDENGRRELQSRTEILEVRAWVQTTPNIRPFTIPGDVLETQELEIRPVGETDDVSQILREEWFFLQRHSLLGSRIKKPFRTFVKSGATAIEVGRRGLRRLEARTLRLDREAEEEVRALQHLRAAAKWMAVGGSGAAALAEPILGAVLGTGAGWFLLLDP